MTAQPNLNTQITKLQAHLDMADLLELAINRHNLEVVEFERLAEYNDQLEAERKEQAERIQQLRSDLDMKQAECAGQAETIKQLEARNAQLEQQHTRDMEAITKIEPIAKAAVAQKRQLEMTQANLAATQKELTALKGGDNPKKLREQVKRNKDKNAELAAKCERLQREATQYRAQLKTERDLCEGLKRELYVQGVKNANGAFTRLWSDGTQNVILWPDAVSMQNTKTGEVSKGRALLYMHNSGRGALLTLDAATGTTQMGEAPKGGLRPTKNVKAFTDAWLYKVNAMQNGDVNVEDLNVTDI